ncbi:hypothetical protein BGX34_004814 [Mortierella sp. NVP85]|nr:hypothetical protein BGX34_004814 [Mortierella sp. NVP85]
MSTAGDGRRASHQDDPDGLRQKYKAAKHKVSDLKEKDLANMEAKFEAKFLQQEIYHSQRQGSSQSASEDQLRRGVEQYQRFVSVMTFMEDALAFVPPASNDNNTLENRLVTIVQHLIMKERQQMETEEAHKKLVEEMEQWKSGERSGMSPNEKLEMEARLTRMMKKSNAEIAELQGILATKEELLHSTAGDWEKKIAELTTQRDAAEQALNDARAKAEDLDRAMLRAEKSKSAIVANSELVSQTYNQLKRNYHDLERVCKEKDGVISVQRKENEDIKRLYDKVKSRSLMDDLENIKSLTFQLRNSESQITKLRAANEEKGTSINELRTRFHQLQDEKNDVLKQLGHLQDELASKDLELSNSRSTSAGFDVAAKIAERERDSVKQQALQDAEFSRQKLSVFQDTIRMRDHEIEFLKAAVVTWEQKSADHKSQLEKERDQARERDNEMATLRATIEMHEAEIAALKEKENERLQSEAPSQELMLDIIKTEMETDEEDLRSNITRAFARLLMLEDLIEGLEQEAVQAKAVHEQVAAAGEELRKANQEMKHQNIVYREKQARADNQLERVKQDLQEREIQLVECRTQLREQELKANVYEEEQKGLHHRIALLEKLGAEQQEQLEGREKALKRREEARKMYYKVYESKIDSLKEEMAAVERIAQDEWKRIRERHEIQISRTMDRYQEALEQGQRNLETVREGLNGDLMVARMERDELKRRLNESEDALQRSVSEIEQRNRLLSGYMALVLQQQDDGMLPPGTEDILNILGQRHDDIMTVQGYQEQIGNLQNMLEERSKVASQYSQNITVLSKRNEGLVRQNQERELELTAEKKTRVKEQAHLKGLLKAKEDAIQILETELREKTDALRRTEAALLKNNGQALVSPVVPSFSINPSAPPP